MKRLFLVILMPVAIIVINACRKTEVQTTINGSIQPGSVYKFDTTITYEDRNPHPDTSGNPIANYVVSILAEWGSYQSFKIPALAGVDTSRIKDLSANRSSS